MAKITANGAHEVHRVRTSDGAVEFLLRSDGAVLQKFVGLTGWGVTARFRRGVPLSTDGLKSVARRRGYEVA